VGYVQIAELACYSIFQVVLFHAITLVGLGVLYEVFAAITDFTVAGVGALFTA
jgi:hypothetical protein